MSDKQKLQRDRAYFKFVISGLSKPICLEHLTSDELINWKIILDARSKILESFDSNSKNLGLNVPEHRCWCGKSANHHVSFPGTGKESIWVCIKHIEDYDEIGFESKRL